MQAGSVGPTEGAGPHDGARYSDAGMPSRRRVCGVSSAAVREGLATGFKGLPDVRYGDDRHWVSGDLGVSEWLLTGTTPDGQDVRVRGCDHWEFCGDKIVRKDSYWEISTSRPGESADPPCRAAGRGDAGRIRPR